MINFIMFILMSLLILLLGILISKKDYLDKEKISPFECGFDPFYKTRTPFSLRFFKIAIIFLIFDIEIVLMLPLPLMNKLSNSSFYLCSEMMIMIILMGLIYEWKEGSLDWVK